MSKSTFSQAGNKISGTLNNHGFSVNGNSFQISGGSVMFGGGDRGDSKEDECKKALFLTNPLDDRGGIITSKPRLVAKACQWIYDHSHFKSWQDANTSSQLLWISGGSAMGKTMLSLFILRELEAMPEHAQNSIILFYFCDGRNDKRNTAVSVLRGLIFLLLKARPNLINLVLSDYEIQKEALFSQTSLEALWRIFETMIKDPSTGSVFCLIDGLDECKEDSLWQLLRKVTNFFEDEKERLELHRSRNLNPASQQPIASLKMILVSREAPKCLLESLGQYPRVQLGVLTKKETRPATTKTVPKKAPKLASIAREALRRQSLDKNAPARAASSPALLGTPTIQPEPSPNRTKPPSPPVSEVNLLSNERVSTPADVTQTPYPTQPSLPQPKPLAPDSADPHRLSNTLSPSPAPSPMNEDTNTSPAYPSVAPSVSPKPDPTVVQPPTPSPTLLRASDQPNKLPTVTVEPVPEEYVFDDIPEEEEVVVEEDPAVEEVIEEAVEEEVVQNQSLVLYIEAKVADLSTERAYPDVLRDSVTTGLQYRGDGTFLWVDLAIEEMKRYEQQYVEKVLEQLPPGLDEMYCRTLQTIPPHLVGLVVAILKWVVAARRPLYLDELAVALGLMNFNAFNVNDMTRQGIMACGSLLTIHEDDAVHIAHTSVKDLLVAKSGPLWMDAGLHRFHVSLEEVDGEIASLCIRYLEQGCLKDGSVSPTDNPDHYNQRVNQFLLLPYSAEFWPDHLRSTTRPNINLSSPFFARKSPIRKNWWLTYYPATTGKLKILAPRNFNIIHMAAYLNIPYIAEQLLVMGLLRNRLNDRDSHGGAPISYAVSMGHMAMFTFLLQQGANLDGLGGTMFELACEKGQGEIIEYLLRCGYDVNQVARDITAMEAVGMATKWLPGVLHEGLELDGDKWKFLMKDTGQRGTGLHSACLYGHVSVVELLLQWNANVHASTTKHWTSLHSASWTGQIECVKLLLEKGANAFDLADIGWIPFHCAASRGKTPVIKLFLELGLPIDTLTAKRKTGLQLAAYSGSASTVRFLAEQGAILDNQSHKNETALHLATRATQPEVVELLLSLGANKLLLNAFGQTALETVQAMKTPTEDQREIIRILETFGMMGYVPWQPRLDANAVPTAPVVQPLATVPNEHMRRASTASAFAGNYPIPPTYAPFNAQQQPQPVFQATYYGSQSTFQPQQPMYPPEKVNFQNPAASQSNAAGPMPYQPTYAGPQRTQSMSAVPLNPQYTAEAYPPPPPYTPSPNAPLGIQTNFPSEKSASVTANSINNQTAASQQQPVTPAAVPMTQFSAPPVTTAASPSATHSSPQPAPVVVTSAQFSPQTVTATSPPAVHSSPQSIPITPQLIIPQYAPQSSSIASYSPSPAPASPIPPSPQIYVAGPPAPEIQQRPPLTGAYTYGPPVITNSSPAQHPPLPPHTYPTPGYTTPQPPQPPPSPYQPLTPNTTGYEQQFSQMSISQRPTTPSAYPQQQQQQQWPPQPAGPSYGSANIPQYPVQPIHPTQQYYSNSPLSPHPNQQYPSPQYPASPGGFLSINFNPSALSGTRGSVGGGLQFAPPPTTQAPEFQRKKSFRNLGGMLK